MTPLIRYLIYKVPRISKFIEAESKWWLPGAGGENKGSYCLKGAEFLSET